MTFKTNKKNIDKLIDALEEFSVEFANDIIDELYDEIKENTPVKTGRAKAGWDKTEELKKLGGTRSVGNEVDYVKYLEDGTRYIAPRNMVKRSIINVGNKNK